MRVDARRGYPLVGGTMCMVYWWVWGKIFRTVGLTME